jgi:hypothetical protein
MNNTFEIINKLSLFFNKLAGKYDDDDQLYNANFKDKVNELSKLNPYPFSSWFGNNGRVYYDINIDNVKDRELSVEDINLINFIKENGYVNVDYLNGYAEKDGRKLRIGKILENLNNKKTNDNSDGKDLKNNIIPMYIKFFESSNYRKLLNKKLKVVFTQNPHDVAKMSTSKGWTSCFNLNSGVNSRYCLQEVKEGGIVAYLINAEDLNIEHPYSRIYIRRFDSFFDGSSVAIPEETIYGEDIPAFKNFVKDWLLQKQKDKLNNFNFYNMIGGRNSTTLAKDFWVDTKLNDVELEGLNKDELFLLLNKKRYIGEKGNYSTIEELKTNEGTEEYINRVYNYNPENILQNIIDKYLNQLNRVEIKQIINFISSLDNDNIKIQFFIKIFPYLEFEDLTITLCEEIFEYLPSNLKDKLSELILDQLDFYLNEGDYNKKQYLKYLRLVKYIPDDAFNKILNNKIMSGALNNFSDYLGNITDLVSKDSSIKIGERYFDKFYFYGDIRLSSISTLSLNDLYETLYEINCFVEAKAISKDMYNMLKELLPVFIKTYNDTYEWVSGYKKISNNTLLILKNSYDFILNIRKYLESNK